MGQFIRKEACPKCVSAGRDHSKDNLAIYEDGSCYCFACHYVKPSQQWISENGAESEQEWEDLVGSHFDEAVHEKLKEQTGLDSKGYRGIRTDVSKYFGVRYSYSEEDGSVTDTYYPATKDGALVGYKRRIHPKDFTKPIGETGKDCDMFMQFRFKTHKDTCLIAGGEHDSLAAYMMLSDKQKADGKTQWDFTACVSSTTGEAGAWKQAQKQYAFFSQFKKIVLALDNDEAGREATEKLAKVLPRGKVYVMNLRFKDCNEYLEQGATKEFINDFWGARMYTPAGIHASVDLYREALNDLDQKKLSLPDFMLTAAEMFGGGLVKQEITLILAKTSIGKTTLLSALTEHWALNEPDICLGVLSLEATAPKYSRNLLSYHLGVPLHRMKDAHEREAFLTRPENEAKAMNLFTKEDGSPRFYVCDDRGANIEQVKEKILEMVIHMGVDVLLIDPYSDLCSGMTVSEQEELATWVKKLMKEYNVTPIIVSHVRKSANGQNAGPITEDDAQGSSFLVKAAGQTIALERDKQSEDPVERNRTTITILKNRDFSETGPAGSIYYDIATATLHDFDVWMNKQDMRF